MTATGTEARVCQDIADRQQVGLGKYGTSVEANPLGLLEWYKHHYTELLDAAVYAKRIIELMEGVSVHEQEVKKDLSEYQQWEAIKAQGSSWTDQSALVEAGDKNIREVKDALSTTLEDGSTLTASYGKAIGGGVFELWWADHMPNASQEEAWREWESVRNPVQGNPADPHAELRKTWRKGQRWQVRCIPRGFTEWVRAYPPLEWRADHEYRQEPDDQDPQAPADDVSKPVEKPWIDWWGGKEWPHTHALVQVRLRDGTIDTGRPDKYNWALGGIAGDIRAYRVIE